MRQTRLVTAAGQSCLMAFDRVNPEAVKWAEKRSAFLVTEITGETRAALRAIIGRAFTDGIPPREAARLIRSVVGLRTDQAQAVFSLRQKITDAATRAASLGRPVIVRYGNSSIRVPAAGLGPDKLRSLLTRYADKLKRQRALLIARTETITASNRGQIELWKQATQKGLLRGTEKKRWSVTGDDRQCPDCAAMRGQTVGLNEKFTSAKYGKVDGPTLHPACRCAVVLAISPPTRR